MNTSAPSKVIWSWSKSSDRYSTLTIQNYVCICTITVCHIFGESKSIRLSNFNEVSSYRGASIVRPFPTNSHSITCNCCCWSKWLDRLFSYKNRDRRRKEWISNMISSLYFPSVNSTLFKWDWSSVRRWGYTCFHFNPCASSLIIVDSVIKYWSSSITRSICPSESNLCRRSNRRHISEWNWRVRH